MDYIRKRASNRRALVWLVICSVSMLLVSGCVVRGGGVHRPVRVHRPVGVYHPVERGQTLWRIAYTYGVDIQDVAELNNIRDPSELKVGQRLFIPGATRVRKVIPPTKAQKKGLGKEKIRIRKGRFRWPVRGDIVVPYGVSGGKKNNGIDIASPEGTPVKAADKGVVIYAADNMKGYGRIIILKHSEDLYTLYSHNKSNMVKVGDKVKSGEVIARVGRSGEVPAPILHFEVREGKKVRNPLFFLP